jgi:hypothetical protein
MDNAHEDTPPVPLTGGESGLSPVAVNPTQHSLPQALLHSMSDVAGAIDDGSQLTAQDMHIQALRTTNTMDATVSTADCPNKEEEQIATLANSYNQTIPIPFARIQP